MAKTELVGYQECPDCGHPDAEIRLTKTRGWAFRYCGECCQQTFSKSEEGSARMIQKCRPKSTTSPAPAAPIAPVDKPVPEKKPPPVALPGSPNEPPCKPTVTRKKGALDDFFAR